MKRQTLLFAHPAGDWRVTRDRWLREKNSRTPWAGLKYNLKYDVTYKMSMYVPSFLKTANGLTAVHIGQYSDYSTLSEIVLDDVVDQSVTDAAVKMVNTMMGEAEAQTGSGQ